MSTMDTPEIEIGDLVALPATDALTIFATKFETGTPHPIDRILSRVHQEVVAFKPDLSTASGRKRIASFARRIAQAKTALETVGEELAREAKETPKRIDATRRHIKTTLDQWRDEVRLPLTEWEAAEDARKARHTAILAQITATLTAGDAPSVDLRQRLQFVQAIEVNAESCDEYVTEYQIARDTAIQGLHKMLQLAAKREAEAKELGELRKEIEARKQAERDEQLRHEGEERARLDAENDLRVERARLSAEIARREAEHKAALADAERRALEAAQNAKREMEAKAKAEAQAKEKLAADKTHRAAINRAAMAAFVEHGADEATAKFIIALIAKGQVPGITINY